MSTSPQHTCPATPGDQGDPIRASDPFPVFRRTGTPDDLDLYNLDAHAERLIGLLKELTGLPRRARLGGLSAQDIGALARTFIIHQSRHGWPLSEPLLRLMDDAPRIRRMTRGATLYLGLPPVKNLQKFLSAADVEAGQPSISLNMHATSIGVDRHTLRTWRSMEPYKRRVRATRFRLGILTLLPSEQAGWDKAIMQEHQRVAGLTK